MRERREANDEADAQQQIATDLRAIPGQMRASEAAFQIGIVELQARKAALKLKRVSRLGRRICTACVTRYCLSFGD